MSYGGVYNPNPPRAWSRVQDQCSTNNDTSGLVYLPLENRYVPLGEADYISSVLYKGNILQYKKNSSSLTKSQRYSQIAKGMWTNRTKTWATQSQTYSNPNNSSLLRVATTSYPSNNLVPGQPLNPAGPYAEPPTTNPNCPNETYKDGGQLVCNTTVNPCTGEIVQVSSVPNCSPTTDSDVPGRIQLLCWNNKLQTYYPKTRLTMNNSTNKWPINYKAFTSAVTPYPPILDSSYNIDSNIITLTWTDKSTICLPISTYNIYQNGILIESVSSSVNTIQLSITSGISDSFYVTALSGEYESYPSNTVTIPFSLTGGYYVFYSDNKYTVFFYDNATLVFNEKPTSKVNLTLSGENLLLNLDAKSNKNTYNHNMMVKNIDIKLGELYNIVVRNENETNYLKLNSSFKTKLFSASSNYEVNGFNGYSILEFSYS